jgi:ABC-type Fe3+-hydroxamate transport system substrate-binding protein
LVHNAGVRYVDAIGQSIPAATAGARIACLVPSITELLFDLGLGPRLVARTGYCIHPRDAVASVPKVGGTKTVNLPKLRRLAPTHCIVNIDENEKPTVDALRAFVPQLIVTHPQAPEDNLALFDLLGGVFGAHERAQALAARWRAAHEALRARSRPPRRVLYLIWQDPWMTVARDTYISRMLALVGWHTLPATAAPTQGAARYPKLTLREPWLRDVQEVLLPTEPYAFTAQDADALRRALPWAGVRFVDGELCSWYGSRSIVGLQYLAALADEAADRVSS